MSVTAVTAVAALITAAPADGGGFVSPGIEEFYWPLVGGDSNWALTRPSVIMLLSVAVCGVFLFVAIKRKALVPGRLQFFGEGLYNFLRNELARDIIGSANFLRFLPFLLSLFVILLLNNIAGVIPFVQYPTMGRIAFPIALTLVVYIVYHAVAIKKKGVGGYIKGVVPSELPGWVKPLMYVLEVFNLFVTRPVTLALRLFANMFAGHLMLLVFIVGGEYMLIHGAPLIKGVGIVSFLFSILISLFELFIELLQAYIFTLLAALYISESLSEEH